MHGESEYKKEKSSSPKKCSDSKTGAFLQAITFKTCNLYDDNVKYNINISI